MAKSSINFQKSSPHSLKHNLREDLPKYLLPREYQGKNETWTNSKSEEQIFQEEIAQKRKGGRTPKIENSRWEAVINLNAEHSIDDVKKVAKHIEDKFNITCTCIALHRDEGHTKTDKKGEEFAIKNYHAHINFITYKDKKQNWRQSLVRPKLKELQTEVAEILGMERGKENSKAVRLEHNEFRAVAKAKEQSQELAKQKDLKAEAKDVREILYGARAERSDYAELEQLVKEQREKIKAKSATLHELKEAMEAFKSNFEKKISGDTTQAQQHGKRVKKIIDKTADDILDSALKKRAFGGEYYDKDEARANLNSFLRENREAHVQSFNFINKFLDLGEKAKEKIIDFSKTIKNAVVTKVARAKSKIHQQEKKLSPADKLRKEFAEKRAKSRKQGVSRS